MNHLDIVNNKKLTDSLSGDHVVIDKIYGGDKLRDKLLCMGILPGNEIEVLSLRKNGPVIVKVNDTRIVIGYGMASKIMIIPVKTKLQIK